MRVERATLRRVGGPLPAAVGNRLTSWNERRGVLLELGDDGGHTGVGEASPLPGASRDDLAGCEATLAAWTGRLPLEIGDGEGIAAAVAAAAALPADQPAARMAVESALFDLLGRRLAVPASALLAGGLPGRDVPLSALLHGGEEAALAAEVRAGLAGGVRTFKLKVGGPDFEAELATIAALRRSCPGGWRLRLDANGAWSEAQARSRLARLAGFGVELVEQPVAAEALIEFAGSPLPLAADETMLLADALDRLIATRSCAAVVLKPTVLGGLIRCLGLGRRAAAAGLGVIVTHAFEGPVALAAACELALALGTEMACGLAPHPALAAFGSARPGSLRADRVACHGLVGLGLVEPA